MKSCCTNYSATLPEITVHMNCDTILAVNLSEFGLDENDEFIFVIKNYNYIESPCVFMFRTAATKVNESGEVVFKITSDASKYLKPGAFYTMAALINAFDTKAETEHKKLTENGKIRLVYGAQDMIVDENEDVDTDAEIGTITNVRLEEIEDIIEEGK